ncbi:YbaL family putative K(+) efflux transporter [Roseateles depolymerans]|uniref:Sodium/hydrogen exchanger n=1 Tax=Roseateles depolymerans TaxID=76731 RepID=A0A0U3MX70_9BURK|nr:YbaL family putative K(+) efflux transporter [Roseateles depolymerans]ALV07619.1 Sodium/hydrogen exchanger [Roseateles depolymerans]REG22158.1 Kef-type potassium/proton antiporter (CPA2 family) [Roseateles depolymerans]
MEHNVSLISTLAAGFGLALIFGFIAERLKLPALVGYLLAGVAIGPATPGFVADIGIASQLSEIGVMLLMFGVGLHFSLKDLMAVKRIALPGAVVQMTVATLLGMGLALSWGWTVGGALVFGLSLSCASTVVLLKALEARGAIDSVNGRIAIGWLVVEDLATVLILVLLPPLAPMLTGVAAQTATETANATPLWQTLAETLAQVAAFVALMLVVGRRLLPWMLWQVARTGSRELFTLMVIAVAIGIAYGASELFHVSFALGAFFAGMVMRESEYSHRAAEESLPLRDSFSVLFFVSVGMLVDPMTVVQQPWHVLGTVLVIILGKAFAATALVLVFRYPLNTAMTVSASLAQIGEFSFILAGLGLQLGLMPKDGMNLVLAGAMISIALNPVMFAAVGPLQRWVLARSAFARKLEQRDDPYAELPMTTERAFLEGQVVLVGYGRVGRRIAQALDERNIPIVVAEQNRETVEALRNQGRAAVSGDASDPMVLIQAHIANAAMLVVALPDSMKARQMAEIARQLNPGIEIVLRTHGEEESALLRKEQLGTVFYGEEELARGMSRHVLQRFNAPLDGAAGQTPATAASH